MSWQKAFDIGKCLDWKSLRVRNQHVNKAFLQSHRYRLIATWTGHINLVQHTRSGALWLVRDDIASVVKLNKNARALVSLWEK